MRILILAWEYPPHVTGGLGTHLAGLAPALVRAGVEVEVITPQSDSLSLPSSRDAAGDRWDGGVLADGVLVHRVPMEEAGDTIYDRARSTNQAMLAVARLLQTSGHSFDLIHAHDWLTVFAAHELKHEQRRPLIATIHATERGRVGGAALYTDLQRSIHGAEWWLVYEAWRVIACSQYMATEVQSSFGAPVEKIDVVANGISSNPNGRYSPEDLIECRARYADAQHPIVFGVGRLVHEKGFHLLINAVPIILAEFPETRFVIAGKGPEAVHLREQATRLGVADHVIFPGFISDKERDCLYKVAACAVFPSLYEPFGIVALEAMAAGCPTIVADVGGLREVVRHGKTGLVVHRDDAHALALGVMGVLRDPARAAVRAAEAQEMVRLEFNWDTIAAQPIDIYRRVIDERGRITW